ncbi:Potassium channel KOR2 [Dendrobium catenatum]|uniref:Potassium channel KOR2 n=1 Tax=Dendrobium catenatum TaxID=906689 RepID=A0A2I0XBJ0_9ASPA|nr:Potassium channel KOR2 [Dendrobium catenatum]
MALNADKFGNSPLFEAVRAGHDKVAKLLVQNGAILNLEDAEYHYMLQLQKGCTFWRVSCLNLELMCSPKIGK